jgi:hypothetical protein
MLEVVRKEQWDRERQRILSSILWDVFTGNEQYRNIFFRSFNVRMQLDLMESITKILARSVYERR